MHNRILTFKFLGYIIVAFLSLCFKVPTALSQTSNLANFNQPEIKPVLVYGADMAFPPYEYIDKNGNLEGFNIDLIKAVASKANLLIDTKALPWKDVDTAITNGSNSSVVLAGMYYDAERHGKQVTFGMPFTVIYHKIFTSKGNGDKVLSLNDLAGKKVLVQTNTRLQRQLSAKYPQIDFELVKSEVEALNAVNKGIADYAIASQAVGVYYQKFLKLDNVVAVGPAIYPSEYCFTANSANAHLVYRLNKALAEVQASGEYQIIYEKWLKREDAFSWKTFWRYSFWVVLVSLLVSTFLLVTNSSLRAKIKWRRLKMNAEAAFRKELEADLYFKNTAIETADIAFILADLEGNIRYVNRAGLQFHRSRSLNEVIGCHFSEFWNSKVQARSLSKRIRVRKFVKQEYIGLRCDNTTFSAEVFCSRVFDKNGNLQGTVAYLHDITKRKRAESRIKQLNTNLEKRIAERTADLSEANKSLEAFNYSISHDLQVPLRAIRGYSRILLDEHRAGLSAEGMRLLGTIQARGGEMQRLIEDLLRFSRCGHQSINLVPVDSKIIIAACLKDLSSSYPVNKVKVSIEGLPKAMADEGLVRQVWQNLLDNAIKFSLQNNGAAKISISGRRKGKLVIFSIKDNGPGIESGEEKELFSMFYQGEWGRKAGGSGIGLALVARIIRKHNGRIWAEQPLGGGLQVSFTLLATEYSDLPLVERDENKIITSLHH